MVRGPSTKTAGRRKHGGSRGDEDGAIRRGDIFWVDAAALAGPAYGGGRMPVLVIQNDTGNTYGATVIVAPLTSNLSSREYPVNVTMPEDILSRPCEARLGFLATVDRKALSERAGSLTPEKMTEVDRALRVSLGLSGS